MKKFLMKFKKQIIFFNPSIEEGGVEKNLIHICNGLTNYFNVILITANNNKKTRFIKDVKYISPNNNFFNKKSRLIKIIVCTYLIFKNFYGKRINIFSFQSNITAIIISKILRNKIIIRANSSPNYYANNFLKKSLMSIFFSLADKIIVNSDHFKKEFQKFFKLKPIRIYNLMEKNKDLKKLYTKKVRFNFFDKEKSALKIISIGRLVAQKDHITILKALDLIKHKKKFVFCLIGKGDQKYNLLRFIKNKGLTGRVKLIGYKKNTYPYYKKADLFILSSKYEGLPNTLLEALSMGVPIISSDCKTGPSEILKKKYGKLFKVGDYKTLSKFINDSKKKLKLTNVNDSRFDFENNLMKYKKVILSLNN